MLLPTVQTPSPSTTRTQGCLLSLSLALSLLVLVLGGYAGLTFLPLAAIAFLLTMLHAIFTLSLYRTMRTVRGLSWVAYGVSLIASSCVLTYAFGQPTLYRWSFAYVAVVLLEISVLSLRARQRRGLLQLLLVGIALVGIPLILCVRNERTLWNAIRADNMGYTRFLLTLGADVRANNSGALFSALYPDNDRPANLDMLRLLLDCGADPNAADNDGTPVLTKALYQKQSDVARMLVAYGANPSQNNSSALFLAVREDNLALIDLFLQHGVNIHARNQFGWSVLFEVHSATAARILIDHGVRRDVRDTWGQTALFNVASNGSIEPVKYLIAQGLDVNARNMDGQTPLMYTIRNINTPPNVSIVGTNIYAVIEYLIDNSDIHAVDRAGQTALDIARTRNHADIIALLLAAMK